MIMQSIHTSFSVCQVLVLAFCKMFKNSNKKTHIDHDFALDEAVSALSLLFTRIEQETQCMHDLCVCVCDMMVFSQYIAPIDRVPCCRFLCN